MGNKAKEVNHHPTGKVTLGLMLIAIGIVYGDIGTSPMYVMKSILEGNGGIANVDSNFIIGSFSLVIWTITLLTTIQFVLIAMKADNNGEGGIFALYSLVRKYGKWLVIVTMIGGATMLADYLFILTALGLSCSTWDLPSLLRNKKSLVAACGI